jgi:uncharacterized membrane protein
MKRNKEIKNDALKALQGHWGWAILVCLVFNAIECLIVAPSAFSSGIMSGMGTAFSDPAAIATMMGTNMLLSSVSTLGGIFGTNPLNLGLSNSLKLFVKDSDTQTIPNMFKMGFGGGRYWRNVLGMFLMGLFTFLWTLLFIIPGIIKSYAYAMTPYILVDNPELSPNEARLKSIEIMRGHKWKYFGLQLSFIGWFLLCILSLGVGFIWLMPYVRTSYAAFYLNLKEEMELKAAPAVPAE